MSKKRGRGDGERFAYIPESLLTSEAGRTLNHAALKVLTILVLGRTKDRNGTMCCSESYAATFGITARTTVMRSLKELQDRSIIVVTRRVTKFKKHPTLYAVTWWPVTHRDGEPLSRPEVATHAYLKWSASTFTMNVDEAKPNSHRAKISSHSPRDNLTFTTNVENGSHHIHGDQKRPIHHIHGEGQSPYLGAGAETSAHLGDHPKSANSRSKSGAQSRAVGKNGKSMHARGRS